MTHQVLARKWRPRTFHEVIGQPHVVKALSNGLDNNRLHHAFLFTGTRGVGKTTLARIFAKSLNCEKGISSTPCGTCSICLEVDQGRFVDLIEIDAASRTKVEDTREILDNVQYAPTRGRYKVYLIDEVHMLSNSSFNALLKTLEEPPSHVKFLLATTDPQKLPVTVLSRCLRLQLKRIHHLEIKNQMQHILDKELIPYDEKALLLISQASEGSMRDALSILDQGIAFTASNIAYEPIKEMLGIIDDQYIFLILQALATKNVEEVIAVTKKISEFALNYSVLLEALITAFHEITLLQINETYSQYDADQKEKYLELKEAFTAEDLQLYYQIALHGRRDLTLHPSAEMGLEMTLLRMVLFSPNQEIETLTAKKKIAHNELNPRTNSLNTDDKILPTFDHLQKLKPDSKDIKSHEAPIYLKEDYPAQKNLSDNLLGRAKKVDQDQAGENNACNEMVTINENNVDEQNSDIKHSEISHPEKEHLEMDSIQDPETNMDAVYSEPILLLSSNQDWLNLVEKLPLESIVRGISHSLIFKSFEHDLLILRRDENDRSFNISEAENEIANAASTLLGKKIACQIEYVHTGLDKENLQQRNERIEQEKWKTVYERLTQDSVVQHLQKECGAELLEKTIKVF